MPMLKVTITDSNDAVTGTYDIDCVERPGLDGVAYDSGYTIDLIRAAAERHRYLDDFPDPPVLSFASVTYDMQDPFRAVHLHNVNEIWFEIQNLLLGARLNFATARMYKELEDGHSSPSATDANARFELHYEKLERFHTGVYELARVEDLIVRAVYEFFGDGFIEVDLTREGWEKRLTWNEMKDALNKRGRPEKSPQPNLESMPDTEYTELINAVRSYRSPEVLRLTAYRDRRTHRVAPTVDHSELGVVLRALPAGSAIPLFSSSTVPEFDFLRLYTNAKDVYAHLLQLLLRLSTVIHA